MEDKAKKNQINIELKEDVAQGTYSNLAIITHSSSEFVLDFARIVPGVQGAKLKSRVIISPHRMKALVKTLESQIVSYEGKFGQLDTDNRNAIGFQNPAEE